MKDYLINISANLVAAIIWTVIVIAFFTVRSKMGFTAAARLFFSFLNSGGVYFYPARRLLQHDKGSVGTYIQVASKEVCYVGLWLASSTENSDILESIKGMARRDVEFRLCFLSENGTSLSGIAKWFELTEDELRDRIVKSREKIQSVIDDLGELGHRIQLLRHDYPITASCFILDHGTAKAKILIDHKYPRSARQHSYGWEIRSIKGGVYENITKGFLKVLDEARNEERRKGIAVP